MRTARRFKPPSCPPLHRRESKSSKLFIPWLRTFFCNFDDKRLNSTNGGRRAELEIQRIVFEVWTAPNVDCSMGSEDHESPKTLDFCHEAR